MLIFAAVTIIIYMVIYALEWSWNYVVLSPAIMDGKNQAKLEEQAGEIATLNGKLVDEQKEIKLKLRLAALMRRGEELDKRFVAGAPTPADAPKTFSEFREWIDQTVALLNEAAFHTDAEALSQISSRTPSADQLAACCNVHEWKRCAFTQLSLSRKKLEEIISSRRL